MTLVPGIRGWHLAIISSFLTLFVYATTASAEPLKVWQAGENCGDVSKLFTGQCGFAASETTSGEKKIETTIPRGVASDPDSGNLYVSDQVNARVVELDAWGEFVKAWGWGVEDGSAELQTCTVETDCLKGIEGDGSGQMSAPQGVAVDSSGGIYVVDKENWRVQKFDRDGNFLLMFGGDVNKTAVEAGGSESERNLCTAASGDLCVGGTPGTGEGAFSDWPYSSFIAVGPDDTVYVGDRERIQEFSPGGVFKGAIDGGVFTGHTVSGLALDPASNILVSFVSTPDVVKLDSSGTAELCTASVAAPKALATTPGGEFYVVDGSLPVAVRHFESDCDEAEPPFGDPELNESTAIATGTACFDSGKFGLYITNFTYENSFALAYNPPDKVDLCPPPARPPTISSQYAIAVTDKAASLGAQINPRFWPDTTYYVEYGTVACIEGEGWGGACVQSTPSPPGTLLESGVVNQDSDAEVLVEGLAPANTYRYRFVAVSSGGGPVIGVGGEVGIEGESGEFTTFSEASAIPPCANDALRPDAGARLRDCRAYELVSPLGKAGGDIQGRLNIVPYEARVDQASVSGNAITFSSYRAFQDPQSGPFSSQYLTRRDPAAGWQTEAISPPQEGEGVINPLLAVDNLFRAFNSDLSQSWLYTYTEPVLGTGGLAGHPNIYRRDSSSGSYEACTTALPKVSEEGTHGPQFQGFSADGSLGIFKAENRFTDNASSELKPSGQPIYQLYACSFDGSAPASVRLVSVLPNGTASNAENTAGGPANEAFQGDQGRTESLEDAISADGSKVFWTASGGGDGQAPGALYLRLNPGADETASGQCEESEPDKACTVLVNAGPARFWKATNDGSIAIFSSATNQLNEYEVATGETRAIAPQVMGVVGASEDVGRVYFVSKAQINGEGVAGQPNLYLYDRGAGSTTFIGTLSPTDTSQNDRAPSPINPEPVWHSARVTPDGSTVAFMSNSAALAQEVAGYDNTDQLTGLPAAEIYRYEIGGELVCVSCNRTGQRPAGRQVQNKFRQNNPPFPAASLLPPWLNSLYAPRVLSDDGDRIFFEAFEPLVLGDVNDKSDVYQWEALGKGSCEESDSAFDPQSNGCVSLITSGQSPNDSQFVDASPSGDDVFVRTASSLVSWDPGAIDIYDARVNGGFPAPPTPAPECEDEACQGPQGSPPPLPATQTTQPSTGNVKEAKPKPKKCRKGTHKVKRKGKVRCVKNKKHPRAHNSRRAGR